MTEPPPDRPLVRAAGGIIVRDGRGAAQEVLLVHRPRYDDWSFPKGKRDGDETDEETALREVLEETGLACTLGRELAPVHYHDNRGRPKVVRYWVMTVLPTPPGPEWVPGDEVDELRWCPPADAAKLLSYAHDRELLEQLIASLGSR